MSFKNDFDNFLRSKGKSVEAFKDGKRVYRYKKPAGRSKPKLYDPDVLQCGPVKVYTREEIEEYKRQLEQERKNPV